MPVHHTVTAAPAAASSPAGSASHSVWPTSARKNSPAGAKVATAATPSRDSQEDRHWLSARQARSGRPRWAVEDSSPSITSTSARPTASTPKPAERGTMPSALSSPIQNSSP